jgi:hypothetical protein
MKHIFLLLLICAALNPEVFAQKQDEFSDLLKTTYPVDSCLYFMDPMDMRVVRQRSLGEDLREYQVQFRSSADASLDYLVRGTGSIFRDSLFFGPIRNGDQLRVLASLPDSVDDPDGSWSGGELPFPSFLNGFIMSIEGQTLNPPVAIGLHVIRHEVIPLDD